MQIVHVHVRKIEHDTGYHFCMFQYLRFKRSRKKAIIISSRKLPEIRYIDELSSSTSFLFLRVKSANFSFDQLIFDDFFIRSVVIDELFSTAWDRLQFLLVCIESLLIDMLFYFYLICTYKCNANHTHMLKMSQAL